MKRKSFLKYAFLLTGFSVIKTSPLSALFAKTRRLFVNKVKFIWSGAVTADSIRVHAKLTTPSAAVRLVVSADPALSNPVYGTLSTADAGNNYIARLSMNGLQPGTAYYYAVEADGLVDTASDAIGTFKTVSNTAHSFKFSIASCNRNGNHPVFYRIKEKNPAFHITHGDFHYGDPNSATDINVHRAPFEDTLAQPAIRELVQHCPIAYMWDDHDYCGDNTNSFAVGRTNARLVYQEYVPHFPLAAGAGNVPIYQSFVVGRIRFILTDLRSERDLPGTTMLGAAQKAWFKTECMAAKNNDQGIVWISTVPWGNTPDTDIWYGFSEERTELSDFFKANAIRNLFIICGDAHMIAIDNGTNHDFSTGGNPFKYHVLQAAAVNQTGSFRGGPFSHGFFQNPSFEYGQYVVVEITDTGGSNMLISLTGYRVNNAGVESIVINYAFNFTLLSVLPITITGFAVKKDGEGLKAILSFQMESTAGSRCKKMVMERSNDGRNYEAIGHIPCHLSPLDQAKYSITDDSPWDGVNHYRLKIIDQDNQVSYSKVVSIEFNRESSVTVLNNPVRHHLQLAMAVKKATTAAYFIQDGAGRAVQKGSLRLSKGRTSYTIDTSGLATGVYFFVIGIDGSTFTEKIVIE